MVKVEEYEEDHGGSLLQLRPPLELLLPLQVLDRWLARDNIVCDAQGSLVSSYEVIPFDHWLCHRHKKTHFCREINILIFTHSHGQNQSEKISSWTLLIFSDPAG